MRSFVLFTFFVLASTNVQASIFFGVGAGVQLSHNVDDTEVNRFSGGYNFRLASEYSKDYRDKYLFLADFEYLSLPALSESEQLLVWSIGFKYTPIFWVEKPNVTESLADTTNPIIFIILAPFAIFYDFYIWIAQISIPSHPFYSVRLNFVKSLLAGAGFGVTIATGLTTGSVDVRLPLRLLFPRAFSGNSATLYLLGLEFSYHFALGEKFIRSRPLIPREKN